MSKTWLNQFVSAQWGGTENTLLGSKQYRTPHYYLLQWIKNQPGCPVWRSSPYGDSLVPLDTAGLIIITSTPPIIREYCQYQDKPIFYSFFVKREWSLPERENGVKKGFVERRKIFCSQLVKDLSPMANIWPGKGQTADTEFLDRANCLSDGGRSTHVLTSALKRGGFQSWNNKMYMIRVFDDLNAIKSPEVNHGNLYNCIPHVLSPSYHPPKTCPKLISASLTPVGQE